ncbi:hypothetical protein NQ315_003453 [Exocentrus adspersus]|uniref:THAP-type domain-containing protein n=1 Tax=Exocentrus adspersus TaxID=1586481 RepID=A0AAV8V799_9CUCU|nr:hypothetical protein NQ315_003453 [Exocentrus adspersus]
MSSCSVKSCRNNRRFPKPGKDISFHVFPKSPRIQLQRDWLKALGISSKNWMWTKNKVVCSEHFRQEDFMRFGAHRYLKLDAAPTLKLDDPDNEFSTIPPYSLTNNDPLEDPLADLHSIKSEDISEDTHPPESSS